MPSAHGNPLALDRVKQLASELGYTLVQESTASCVVAFKRGHTRINVYWTTGTVATCINHPTQGKTQLFRRNVSVEQLAVLFRNPRQHTGKGYYRAAGDVTSAKARNAKRSRKRNQPYRHERGATSDDALRWRFVQARLGPWFCSEQIIGMVASVCTQWTRLFSQRDRTSDGCRCACIDLLTTLMARHYGAVYFRNYRSEEQVHDIGWCSCEPRQCFQRANSAAISKLERQFTSLPHGVRKELLLWYVGKVTHSLVVLDANKEKISSDYGRDSEFVGAHLEYGELFYNKNDGVCAFHGSAVSV